MNVHIWESQRATRVVHVVRETIPPIAKDGVTPCDVETMQTTVMNRTENLPAKKASQMRNSLIRKFGTRGG
jgi:hypothetical protein